MEDPDVSKRFSSTLTPRACVAEPDAGTRPCNTQTPSSRVEEHDVMNRFSYILPPRARVAEPGAGTQPFSPQTPHARVDEPDERKRFLTHLRLVPV